MQTLKTKKYFFFFLPKSWPYPFKEKLHIVAMYMVYHSQIIWLRYTMFLQEDVPNPFFQVISPAKFEGNFQKQLAYEEAGSVCMESTYYTKHTKKEEKTLKVYSNVWSDHICS